MIIRPAEYAERRRRLLEKMEANSLAILGGAPPIGHKNAPEDRFRQESYFYYLTGCNVPEAYLVLTKEKGEKAEEEAESESESTVGSYLFLPPANVEKERWEGKQLRKEEAVLSLGFDETFSLTELEERMVAFLKKATKVFFRQDDERLLKKVRKWRHQSFFICTELAPLLATQRLYKSFSEIALIREACAITAEAHQAVMKFCRPHRMEYELEGEFRRICCENGCPRLAYSPIIAGGAHACTLHYCDNDAVLMEHDLVLVDAGGEYRHYASDITRTFPVNGRFTVEQKAIYEIVLHAQKAAIEKVFPGQKWASLQEIIVQFLTKGLIEIGILRGNIDDLVRQEAYRPFYYHSSGHWIGLDVHDAGEYSARGKSCRLEAGMVLTVEPGLYIAAGEAAVEPRWRGIGVRIEDVVLVTGTGYEVLTESVPKSVEEIEKLCQTEKGGRGEASVKY